METFTLGHPYLAGFVKFAVLATAGELLAGALAGKGFVKPYGLVSRVIVWGLMGISITLVFKIFYVASSQLLATGLLPGGDHPFWTALWTASLMNGCFGPTMMGGHRVFDAWLDLKAHGEGSQSLTAAMNAVDWGGFGSFVIAKTIPFFWIPAHTMVFLLPEQYRVIAAAFLSIALGVLLALASARKKNMVAEAAS